jgi:hypothetical protein
LAHKPAECSTNGTFLVDNILRETERGDPKKEELIFYAKSIDNIITLIINS